MPEKKTIKVGGQDVDLEVAHFEGPAEVIQFAVVKIRLFYINEEGEEIEIK